MLRRASLSLLSNKHCYFNENTFLYNYSALDIHRLHFVLFSFFVLHDPTPLFKQLYLKDIIILEKERFIWPASILVLPLVALAIIRNFIINDSMSYSENNYNGGVIARSKEVPFLFRLYF